MARPKDDAADRKAEEAAFLRAAGHSQEAIASRLHTTQSNVSRLLKRAEALKCYVLDRHGRFLEAGVSPDRLRELEGLDTRDLLETLRRAPTKSGVLVRSVRVVDDVGIDTTPEVFRSHLAAFGRSAASAVIDVLTRARCVAVTWGGTLASVVDGLGRAGVKRVEAPITFFPVSAEPEAFVGAPESSSVIAARLSLLVNATLQPQLALSRIPAFIPKRLTGERRKGVEAMIAASESYRKVFGSLRRGAHRPKGALIQQADALLTSIGHADHPMGFNYDELLEAGRVRDAGALVVGDIGGVLIPRDEHPRHRRTVEILNRMWTGLKYDELAGLATRANRHNTPGVVVISCGSNRQEILHAVVRHGLANELILDRQAADSLARQLRKG